MASKNKGDHSFVGDYNVSSGNEVGSGNHFFFNFDSSASLVGVLFIAGLIVAVIVYMAHDHGSLLAFLVAAAFILTLVAATGAVVTIIACKTWLTVSNTATQHKVNQQKQVWAERVHQLPSGQVASYDADTRKLAVHSVRDVQEVRHYQPPQIVESTSAESFPSLYDLTYVDGDK